MRDAFEISINAHGRPYSEGPGRLSIENPRPEGRPRSFIRSNHKYTKSPIADSIQNHGQEVNATTDLYQTEWIAQGLKEQIHRVTLRVTGRAGHAFTDPSLTFSDPAAGNGTPGSTAYPSGAMRRVGAPGSLSQTGARST